MLGTDTYRSFGKTGLRVSPLGFGGAPVGLLATEQEQTGRILNQLLDLGVNLIDTAASYGGSEEAIGNTVGHRRAEYVLVSKCGQAFPDLPGAAWSPMVIAATVDRALRRLKTDYLDVMLLHTATLDVLQHSDALATLVKAREAGKVRFVGVSGDNEAMAYAATLPDVAVIEMSVNIVDQANFNHVLPLTEANNIGVLAKRPIANSAWRKPEELKGFYQNYARPYHERFQELGISLADLGYQPGEIDWAEVALRFTLSLPGVHCAIIGTSSLENARRNVTAASHGPLPDAIVQQLRAAFQHAQAASQQTWPSLT